LAGLPVRTVMIDLEKSIPLDQAIEINGLNILYVPPLRAFDVKTISTISRARKILTLTGVPAYSIRTSRFPWTPWAEGLKSSST